MSNQNLMGLREYARHRGVTLRAVQDAIKSGRINYREKDGAKKIDQVQADIDWDNNTNLTHPTSAGPLDGEKVKGPNYQQSRAIREAYQAKLAKIEYEQKIEKLVDAEQVKREAFILARTIRDSFLSIPARVSGEILGCKDAFDIEQILVREFNEVLKQLSKGDK